MARHEVVMPQMGESITNGTITRWAKNVGDSIEVDEILLEISTDKVESEIPAAIGGRVAVVLFKEGDTVDVGIKIAEIEDDPSAALDENTSDSSEDKVTQKESLEEKATVSNTPEKGLVSGKKERSFYTPLVRAMAKEAEVSLEELARISGTGAGGRINKKDLENYLENREGKGQDSPISSSESTGPSFFKNKEIPSSGERIEVIPMDNMRKAIAKNMVASKMTSPHVNSVEEVDLSHIVSFREKFKNEFYKQEGFKITYTPFIIYAIIQALKEFPMVNASIDKDNILVRKDINLGVAVAVPGNGLMVPVIHNADSLNMTGICRILNDLATRARNKKITLDELQGGTFTFTNVGSFGTLLATPVILQPQVGIYASGVIQKRVVVLPGDVMGIRSMMYGTHTYDHRLVDGEMGGKFLAKVHQNLVEMSPEQHF